MKGQKPLSLDPRKEKKLRKMLIFKERIKNFGCNTIKSSEKMLFWGSLIGNNHRNFFSPSASPPFFKVSHTPTPLSKCRVDEVPNDLRIEF